MKTLVVGGGGFIGGDAAICLAAQGHDVTIGGRRPAPAASPMANFPLLTGDFFEGGFTVDELRGFDAVIFAAGSDVRHRRAAVGHPVRPVKAVVPGIFGAAGPGGGDDGDGHCVSLTSVRQRHGRTKPNLSAQRE